MLSGVKEFLGVSNLGSQCFKKADPQKMKRAAKGVVVGGAAGAVAGGAAGYLEGKYEILRQPVNAVDLQWSQPVLEKKLLGEIPKEYFVPGAHTGNLGPREGYVPVTVNAPLLDEDGSPQMKLQMKVFSDHGEPQVSWQAHKITDPKLTGYEEHVTEQGHTVMIGKMFYHMHDGYRHSFTPAIEEKVVGGYRTPEVTFETGVSLVSRTLWGILLGMGVGAVSGAILASIVSRNQGKGSSSP